MTHEEKIVGIYHGDCPDGTGAAAVLLKKFPSIKLFPLKHHFEEKDFAPILEAVDDDTTVYTVDNVLGVEEFVKKAKEVISLDHHIGANEEMKAFAAAHRNFTYIFDNNKSGSSLTWTHFFGEDTMPELVKFIEDIDIWRNAYGDRSKHSSLFLIPYVNRPDAVLGFFSENVEKLLEKGEAISDFADYIVESFVARAEPTYVKIGESVVPAFNAQHIFVSDIGHALSEKLEMAVMLFRIRGERAHMSFRSSEGQTPTALALAESVGGGGHVLAAGAHMPLQKFCGMIVHENHETQGTQHDSNHETQST